MSKGNNEIDIPRVQAYLNNLKLQNAAASVCHSNSSAGLKMVHQTSMTGSTGSGSSISNLAGIVNNQVYARSTSRGKEHAHYSQA